MTLLIIYFLLATAVSFMCSLLESVILSVSPAYIAVMEKKGSRSGRLLWEMKQQIDRPLSAILTLNTVSHTVGAAGVGAQVQAIYGDEFLTIASAVLTLVILVFSEIIPKTLGASNWKALAPSCAYVIRALVLALYPFVILSEFLSTLLTSKRKRTLTREEMMMTAELGAHEGAIRKKEGAVIKNLLMLDALRVGDIMTPRGVMLALDQSLTVKTVMDEKQPIRFSRIPVYEGNVESVSGVVHRYSILEAFTQGKGSLTLSELSSPIHRVPTSLSVSSVLDRFIQRKEHIFLAVDEYGSTAGLVSLEDALESLLGVEIMDEFDTVEDMRDYALEQWHKRKG